MLHVERSRRRGEPAREVRKGLHGEPRETEGPCCEQGGGMDHVASCCQQAGSLPHLTSSLDIFSCPLSQKQLCARGSPAGLAPRLRPRRSSELGLARGVVWKVASALFDLAELPLHVDEERERDLSF